MRPVSYTQLTLYNRYMATGKWIGGLLGFLQGGALGALAGFALGWLFDNEIDAVDVYKRQA